MTFGSLEEVFHYIESFTNLEKSGSMFTARTYRLDRMGLLLEQFGQPQLAYRTIHIAGTKGKGSTATLLAHALQAAGKRTGLYTSPHVTSYMERMEVMGSVSQISTILALAGQIREAVECGEACSLRDVSRQLGVGTQCGKCGQCARNLIKEALTAPIADQAQPQPQPQFA